MSDEQQRVVDLTPEMYLRWLRAQRPSIEWFAVLSTIEQEALAAVGDSYVEDCGIMLGMAIRDPHAARIAADAAHGDESAAEAMQMQAAARMAEKLGVALSFAGIGQGSTTLPGQPSERPSLLGVDAT